jgi:hypothetical protein
MSCDFFQYLIEVGWVSVAAESAGGFDEKLAQCARSGTHRRSYFGATAVFRKDVCLLI